MPLANTLKHKESRAKRKARHVMKRGTKAHRTNNSPAAQERQMRRKARNKHEKAKLEYESGMNGHLISITLVQPEEQ